MNERERLEQSHENTLATEFLYGAVPPYHDDDFCHLWPFEEQQAHALCGSTNQHESCIDHERFPETNGHPLVRRYSDGHRCEGCGAPLCPFCAILLDINEGGSTT